MTICKRIELSVSFMPMTLNFAANILSGSAFWNCAVESSTVLLD